MNVKTLVNEFINNPQHLTLKEIQFLLENEEHEIFAYDFGLYREILDYADYLEMEEGA
jgi:hypothetical protein